MKITRENSGIKPFQSFDIIINIESDDDVYALRALLFDRRRWVKIARENSTVSSKRLTYIVNSLHKAAWD